MKRDLDYMISVMTAAREGKEIEFREYSSDYWNSIVIPTWDWGSRDYRVKREPRVIWVNEREGILGASAYQCKDDATVVGSAVASAYKGAHRQIKFIEVLDDSND